jgi:hypothetical protein
MNTINAVPHALNHVVRTTLGHPSPSWTRTAVLMGSLGAVGLASVAIEAAHAAPPLDDRGGVPSR